jgi:hypothetical protein
MRASSPGTGSKPSPRARLRPRCRGGCPSARRVEGPDGGGDARERLAGRIARQGRAMAEQELDEDGVADPGMAASA